MPDVRHAEEFIGVRPRDAVAAGAAVLAAQCERRADRDTQGALAAYAWALDPVGPAPVTGRRLTGPLAEIDLAVEERRAIQRARDERRPGTERAFARGAAGALQWLLGFQPIGA
ncbi:hypothetical protein ACFVHB_34250 [Kitasatospora sp. NPDC127111]|uniref:hypothetical protein n=1 Tax=Kitasatospora sp. NPDC127111 TaxID=3345363 RepID=UPI0036412FDA